MSDILNRYSFNNPEMFVIFVIIIAHILWYLFYKKNIGATIRFSNTLLISKKKSVKEKLIHLPYILNVLAISLMIISLARPQTENNWEETKTKGIDIIIAMDISGSMLAKDLKPDRLTASKEIAIDFILQRKNDRIGLVVFGGESFTQCPLTSDHSSLINLFNDIKFGMIKDGTAIGEGLGNSINRLINSEAKSKTIILLTDGENNSGKISPYTAASIASSDSINIKIYTIGVGTKGMAKSPIAIDMNGRFVYDYVEVNIDEETLQEIAESTGGKYFRATDNNSLKEIYEKINQLETTEIKTNKFSTKNEEFYTFSLISLIMLLLSFLLEITYFRKIN